MIRILIVEDEKPISDLIRLNLQSAGYLCDCAFDGLEAAQKVESNRYDLILLDVMLPEANGYELMPFIRHYDTPVIFLTAKNSVEDKVKGLKLGADDYLVKPFEIIELLARVETVLRRYNLNQRTLEIDDLVIDTASRTVKKAAVEISLTKKEYELLLFFIRNKNIALYRDKIYEMIWESDYLGDSRTVDLHVQRLRKKLNWENKITSVYKVGYRLEIT
ncbi:MAG: response regulator transcription factor [Peptococcaceae bacterium]|nr:response regulator transcription factor [Peptococcaceae bacterium]